MRTDDISNNECWNKFFSKKQIKEQSLIIDYLVDQVNPVVGYRGNENMVE
jgi:hypothetical protein